MIDHAEVFVLNLRSQSKGARRVGRADMQGENEVKIDVFNDSGAGDNPFHNIDQTGLQVRGLLEGGQANMNPDPAVIFPGFDIQVKKSNFSG